MDDQHRVQRACQPAFTASGLNLLVLPAASSPNIRILISLLPNNLPEMEKQNVSLVHCL